MFADFVADMLFNDEDGIDRLLNELDKPTRVKFIEWILDLLDSFKAVFSEDARQLQEIKRLEKKFAKLLTETKMAKSNENKTKYYLSYTTDNKAVAVIDKDIFDGKFNELSESGRIKIAKNAIKKFRPGVPMSGRLIGVTRKTLGHFTNSDYTDKIRNNNKELYATKMGISQNIDDVVYASTDYINESLKHPRNDNIEQFARGTVLLKIGKNKYKANVLVGYTSMQDMVLYDIQDLVSTEFILKEKKAQSKLAGNESYTRKTIVPSSENKIPQTKPSVKQFSLEETDTKENKKS